MLYACVIKCVYDNTPISFHISLLYMVCCTSFLKYLKQQCNIWQQALSELLCWSNISCIYTVAYLSGMWEEKLRDTNMYRQIM
jgi:hypothetical protein